LRQGVVDLPGQAGALLEDGKLTSLGGELRGPQRQSDLVGDGAEQDADPLGHLDGRGHKRGERAQRRSTRSDRDGHDPSGR